MDDRLVTDPAARGWRPRPTGVARGARTVLMAGGRKLLEPLARVNRQMLGSVNVGQRSGLHERLLHRIDEGR
ncbi:MAG: hypothetical protein HRU14_14520, partial [Planctomycetes bacterium]|nr:hypothetical protein [Planctomycetota bacterium]